jgi:integrase
MSLYQPSGSKKWVFDFHFEGQRIRGKTGTSSKTLAERIERKRRYELEESVGGVKKKKKNQALLFSVAAEHYIEKKVKWAGKTLAMAQNSKAHLLPHFGKRLLLDLEPEDIRRYQKKRTAEGASPRSINIEIGFLRSVMGSSWAWLQEDDDDKVVFLPEPDSIGNKVPPEEETILLRECNRSRCRMLYPFVVLAIETGARKNVIRTLQWKWIDFANRCIQFGKDKTPAGTGRIIPLNQRALEVLKMWALQFPDRQPEHFVFPAEKYGAALDEFEPATYDTDPTQPIKSIKESWEGAKKRAGVKCRFHDLKHTAVSRMLDAGVPIAKVAKIVAGVPRLW